MLDHISRPIDHSTLGSFLDSAVFYTRGYGRLLFGRNGMTWAVPPTASPACLRSMNSLMAWARPTSWASDRPV
jgi:hypothetical protein